MEQPTPVSTVTSESGAGQVPSNERFRDIQQEYLEQWNVLANLESDLASEADPQKWQESPASFQNSAASANVQDIDLNNGSQREEGVEEWFILGNETSSEGVGPGVPSEDGGIEKHSISDPDVNTKQKAENITELSPYSEQWYELEQLKASVRSLSHAAGLPQSPQPSQQADETLASALSSGSLSVENLYEAGLQDTKALPQEGIPTQDGAVMMGVAQEAAGVAERVQQDDPDDSGTSFSMDESGVEDKQLRNQWFPLRPSAVGEDDEDTSHVTVATSMTAPSSSSDRLQHIPHAWSDDDGKQSPPERSQPDGRDGPDLKRTPWVASTQPVIAPPAQSSDLSSGSVTRKNSGSDVSVLSQPQSDHNITPLDIITRSVPPAKKGVSLMSELRQRHAPQLNSDSDTESPVSKLLGPNFRAVQQVLDRLKQDKLTDSVSDELEDVASEERSLTEESIKSVSSAGVPTHTTLSRDYGAEWTSEGASSDTKPRSSIDAIKSYEALSSRLLPAHNVGHTGDRHSLNESHRRYSESNVAVAKEVSDTRRVSSWANARVPYDTSAMSPLDAVPKSTQPAANKYLSQDLLRFSSTASSATNVRMPTSTQPAAKQSSHELIRFSSTASSATNVRMPTSTQPAAKISSQELIRFSSEASSAANVKMPKSTQLAANKSTQELAHFSSAASSATNARIAGGGYPPPSTKDSEFVSHHSLIDDEPIDTLPPPLLPTSSRYLPEQTSRNSVESSLKTSRIAWGEHATPSSTTAELMPRTSDEALPSSRHASLERLHDLTPRSSTGSSIPTSRAESRIPTISSRELRGRDPKEEMSTASPADPLAFPGQTSSDLGDRLRATSNDPGRTEQDQREAPENASSLHHLRDSDASASSDDTDELLTYEPVLEGDRQYLRMQQESKRSGARQKQSAAIETGDDRVPARSSRDIDAAARISGKEQSPSTLHGQEGVHGTPLTLDDSHFKSLHWSLGAGTISPISVTSLGQLDSQREKSSTPLGPISEASSALETGTLQASERSSVLDNGTLQEQSLEEDKTSVQTGDRDVAASKSTESRSTTDFSSSDEMYRPVLYRDGLGNKENRPDEGVFQTSSYGIYDIRKSSGPGSTNRRRKALGLEPNPARQTPSQNGAGMVYISGESTPSSVRDGRGKPLGRVDDSAGRISAYRETQPELDYYERRVERNNELRRLRTKDYQLEREAKVLKSRQARVVPGKRDRHHDDYLPREDRRSDRSQGYQSRSVSSKESSIGYRTPEKLAGESRDTSSRSRQLAEHYMDITDPKGASHSLGHGRRSGSSGKSRSKYTDDVLAPSSQQERPEKASGRRKHTDAKTRHRSGDGRDLYGGKATRLDANITKLSSLISKSTDESISSSSQTSVIPAYRRSQSKSKKHKVTSSSDLSDVSEYFNYAFMEPRLRSSIKHKMRLRELLKSVKSRDMSPIVRARDSSATESTSNVSSNETVEREKEEGISDRGPSPAVTHPPRPQAFEIPFSTSRPPVSEPEIPCTCRQKTGAQMTAPDNYRTREERYDVRLEYGMPRKRDVGVNCPTPVVIRSRSPSSDYSPQLEDASTQTEELGSRHKVKRRIDTEPVKSQRKSVKSPLRNVEERGVISQPSPQKSDFIYRVDQRETHHKPNVERLIASQNSPDHGVQPSSDRTSRAPVPTWFLPMTSKPQTEQRTVTQLKTPSKSRGSDEIRVDVFDSAVNPSPSLQKLSLQEAFLYARPQFVKRSQERVARIEEAAREKERRKQLAEAAAEENRIAEALKAQPSKSPVYTPELKPHVKSAGQLHVPKPRQMTRAEIKEQNKRLYKNLPEVKAKNEQMKRQAFYRTNRLRAQLYDKRVRNRLKGAGK